METNVRGAFLFSPIFEKEEDCRDNPFVFEKFDLTDRGPEDLKSPVMKGFLLRQKKEKGVSNLRC
jgi:hypothetical protein